MIFNKKAGVYLFFLLLFGSNAFADEQLFGYTQSSETLPKGGSQLYQWITHRSGRGQGNFSAQDYRTEFEYGITNRLQTSLYLNTRSFQIQNSAPIQDGSPTYSNRNDSIRFDGFSMAFKYNVLSPFIPNKFGGIGLALYIEPGYSGIFNVTGEDMRSPFIETKIIIQKNFLEDRVVTAFNLEPSFVKRKFTNGNGLWQDDLELNISTAATYMLHSNWYAGFEARYHSEYPQVNDVSALSAIPNYGPRQQWVFFAGPTVHYTTYKWWFTFTWLKQFKGAATSDDITYYNGPLHLVDHERNEFRIKIAYNF